jgi:hypothetical protein
MDVHRPSRLDNRLDDHRPINLKPSDGGWRRLLAPHAIVSQVLEVTCAVESPESARGEGLPPVVASHDHPALHELVKWFAIPHPPAPQQTVRVVSRYPADGASIGEHLVADQGQHIGLRVCVHCRLLGKFLTLNVMGDLLSIGILVFGSSILFCPILFDYRLEPPVYLV